MKPQWSIKISGAPPSCKAARIQSMLTVNMRALVIDFLIDFSDWSAICNLSILPCSQRHKHARRIGEERFERASSRNNLFIGRPELFQGRVKSRAEECSQGKIFQGKDLAVLFTGCEKSEIFQQLLPVDCVRRPEGWNMSSGYNASNDQIVQVETMDLSTLQFGGNLCRLKDVAIAKLNIM